MTTGVLKSSAFEDFENIGSIYIRNTKFFIDILSTFRGEIEIEVIEEHTLKLFNDTREAYVMLAEESICDNVFEGKKLEIDSNIQISMSKADLSPIIKDMNLLKLDRVSITKEGEEINFQVGKAKEYDYIKNKMTVEGTGDVNVCIGSTIIDFFNTLDDDFIFELGVNIPLVMFEETKHMSVKTIVAPIVEN